MPFALPAEHLATLDRVREGLAAQRAANAWPPLKGPAAERVRAAKATIRRLARRPPPSGGVPAALNRKYALIADADGAKGIVKAPAVFSTELHLRAASSPASELPPDVARLLYIAEEARRKRQDIKALMERVLSKNATPAERTRLRHLTAAATDLVSAHQAELIAKRVVPKAPEGVEGAENNEVIL